MNHRINNPINECDQEFYKGISDKRLRRLCRKHELDFKRSDPCAKLIQILCHHHLTIAWEDQKIQSVHSLDGFQPVTSFVQKGKAVVIEDSSCTGLQVCSLSLKHLYNFCRYENISLKDHDIIKDIITNGEKIANGKISSLNSNSRMFNDNYMNAYLPQARLCKIKGIYKIAAPIYNNGTFSWDWKIIDQSCPSRSLHNSSPLMCMYNFFYTMQEELEEGIYGSDCESGSEEDGSESEYEEEDGSESEEDDIKAMSWCSAGAALKSLEPDRVGTEVGEGWYIISDPSLTHRGRPYYWNKSTQEAQYHPPAHLVNKNSLTQQCIRKAKKNGIERLRKKSESSQLTQSTTDKQPPIKEEVVDEKGWVDCNGIDPSKLYDDLDKATSGGQQSEQDFPEFSMVDDRVPTPWGMPVSPGETEDIRVRIDHITETLNRFKKQISDIGNTPLFVDDLRLDPRMESVSSDMTESIKNMEVFFEKWKERVFEIDRDEKNLHRMHCS